MKAVRLLLSSAVVLFAAVSGVHAAEWQLVWADEFDYKGLPDPTKWDYEEGFVRNNESQYYTRARLENARVENGFLTIECRKEEYKPAKPTSKPVHYTAASVVTKGKADWKYGRIEVKAKIPQGRGVWPAIWMLGTNISKVNWPKCGEIDIMEFVGKEPDHIYGTIHYGIKGKHQQDGKNIKTPAPYDDFHIYAAEWTPDHIDIYFDKQKYQSFKIDKATDGEKKYNPFRRPQYLLMNFALGGAWGGPIDDAVLPQKFVIDYVRVYKQAEK